MCACVVLVNGEGGSEEEEKMEEEEVEGEEEETKKILQQGDTAVIYPEAPEECTTPDRGGADENGTPCHHRRQLGLYRILHQSFYIHIVVLNCLLAGYNTLLEN